MGCKKALPYAAVLLGAGFIFIFSGCTGQMKSSRIEEKDHFGWDQRAESTIFLDQDQAYSSLLRDRDLNIIRGRAAGLDKEEAWMYSTDSPKDSPVWIPHVRKFNLRNFETFPKKQVKALDEDSDWETANIVFKISDYFYVMFYTEDNKDGNRYIRCAKASSHDGPFKRIPGFQIAGEQEWEGNIIEADPGARIAREEYTEAGETFIDYWILYSNQGNRPLHQSGWARVRINLTRQDVSFIEKHPGNPVKAINIEGHPYNRVGGTYPDFKIDGLYVFYYLSKPDHTTYYLARALSHDPLFETVLKKEIIGRPVPFDNHSDQRVFEKFSAYWLDDEIVLLEDVEFMDHSWGGIASQWSQRCGKGKQEGKSHDH
jgi:hypothetical protein